MKILKIYPKADNPSRYNYSVNYGDWDSVFGDKAVLEYIPKDFNFSAYDVVFLPFWKRLKGFEWMVKSVKDSTAKSVLFDNDSCYRSFDDKLYDGIDFVFYRCRDKNNKIPNCSSAWWPWSVDTGRFTPNFNSEGVLFSCTVLDWAYPLRMQIHKNVIKNTPLSGEAYSIALSNHAAAIHTDSHIVSQVRAKALEMAACGTQIISNRTENMDYFFPDDMITYFDTLDELKDIVDNFKPNRSLQRELVYQVCSKHNCYIRANEILREIEELF